MFPRLSQSSAVYVVCALVAEDEGQQSGLRMSSFQLAQQ